MLPTELWGSEYTGRAADSLTIFEDHHHPIFRNFTTLHKNFLNINDLTNEHFPLVLNTVSVLSRNRSFSLFTNNFVSCCFQHQDKSSNYFSPGSIFSNNSQENVLYQTTKFQTNPNSQQMKLIKYIYPSENKI